jgi:hypothetical protein
MPKESLPAFACEYYLVVRHVFCCFAALCSRVHQWRAAAFCAKERAVRSWCCGEVLSLNAVWEWNGKAKGLPACLPACDGACVCVCVCVCEGVRCSMCGAACGDPPTVQERVYVLHEAC